MTNIVFIGAGYVGAVTAAVFAEKCPQVQVIVLDKDHAKIAAYVSSQPPIFETGLTQLISARLEKNLLFTTDYINCLKDADIIFITVGTPTKTFGVGAGLVSDMCAWESCGRMIAEHCEKNDFIVVEKSTVPVHTADALRRIISTNRRLNGMVSDRFEVISNPEFLAEGTAIDNIRNPDRVLIGGLLKTEAGSKAIETIRQLYLNWVPTDKILLMETWSAELAKLSANAFLAQRISSINSLLSVCRCTGARIADIHAALRTDQRIGPKFLQPSIGFGGSCFKKDILSLVYLCESFGLNEVADYWKSVVNMNDYVRTSFCKGIVMKMLNTLRGKTIAILGFTYKAFTGDVRESSAAVIAVKLLAEKANLRICDPETQENEILAEIEYNITHQEIHDYKSNITIERNPLVAVKDSNAIVIATEWPEFQSLDYNAVYETMRKPAYVFDGRNLLDRAALEAIGFLVSTLDSQ